MPQSPRVWLKRYEEHLRSLGWSQCDHELCLWEKESKLAPGSYLQLSVYVDDNFLSGMVDSEVESIKAILSESPGKVIHPKDTAGGWLLRDAFGADFTNLKREKWCSRCRPISRRSPKSSMYMKLPLHLFVRPVTCKKRVRNLTLNTELVGTLQWMCTIARPDIARPVKVLAQHLSEKVTKGMGGHVLEEFLCISMVQENLV